MKRRIFSYHLARKNGVEIKKISSKYVNEEFMALVKYLCTYICLLW
jgi:hypothetical protein